MTPRDRNARGVRAKAALDEFVKPLFEDVRAEYARRITDIATTELNPETRRDKITALSVALKVIDQIEGGLKGYMLDGEQAAKEILKADKLEKMPAPRRRLLSF